MPMKSEVGDSCPIQEYGFVTLARRIVQWCRDAKHFDFTSPGTHEN